MDRVNSTVFKVPYGNNALPMNIASLLFIKGADPGTSVIQYTGMPNYNGEDVVWVPTCNMNELLAIPAFWECILNGTLVPFLRFNARVAVDYATNGTLANDNSHYCVNADKDFVFGQYDAFIDDETYNNNFILTESYIDSIATSYEPIGEYEEGYSKVRAWIRDRREFGECENVYLNQSDENLIQELKNIYVPNIEE
jgi:hypothetical protein